MAILLPNIHFTVSKVQQIIEICLFKFCPLGPGSSVKITNIIWWFYVSAVIGSVWGCLELRRPLFDILDLIRGCNLSASVQIEVATMRWPRFELRQELWGGLGSNRFKLRPRKWKTVCHIKRNTLIFDDDAFTVPILNLSCFNIYKKNWKNVSQNKLAAVRRNKCTVTLVSGLNRSGLIWFGLRPDQQHCCE